MKDGSGNHRVEEEVCCSGFDGATVSLAGRAVFRSHLHSGQRVATE
jgi:hypothetical protein